MGGELSQPEDCCYSIDIYVNGPLNKKIDGLISRAVKTGLKQHVCDKGPC